MFSLFDVAILWSRRHVNFIYKRLRGGRLISSWRGRVGVPLPGTSVAFLSRLLTIVWKCLQVLFDVHHMGDDQVILETILSFITVTLSVRLKCLSRMVLEISREVFAISSLRVSRCRLWERSYVRWYPRYR